MTTLRSSRVLTLLLLLGATGCADLDIANPIDPTREQALRSASDVESLVAGSWTNWWRANHTATSSAALFLSVAAFQHSSNAANWGMLNYGAIPRIPIQNEPTHTDWIPFSNGWFQVYRALAAAAEGLRAVEESPAIQQQLGPGRLNRLRVYAKFMQGLGHANIAVLYHEGFVIDETMQLIADGRPADLGAPKSYAELMAAAIGYWQQAIDLAEAGGMDAIPEQWIGRTTAAADLARLAYSLRAEYRASVARTPDERRDLSQGGLVDWRAVLADVEKGFQADWGLDLTRLGQLQIMSPSWDAAAYYQGLATWTGMSYMISGMADQSGTYQKWLAQPVAERHPDNEAHGPFLIRTPDRRFPQGATVAEQAASPGSHWQIPDPYLFGTINPGWAWTNPARGTWRWSYYQRLQPIFWYFIEDDLPWVESNRMRLLAAEAHFRLGDLEAAAALINVTRVGQGGLAPTDAAGANPSCVPRLPGGACGDLWEMLKWEQRENSWGRGPVSVAWYFDGRGWGDLYRGTPLDFPIPRIEAIVLGIQPYTRGGVGQPGGAPQSSYAWPWE